MIQKAQAESLVRRARLGDQNAMALIAETSRSAKLPEGGTAREALKLILAATKALPLDRGAAAFQEDETLGRAVKLHLGVIKHACRGSEVFDEDEGLVILLSQALLNLAAECEPEADPVAVVILARGAPLTAMRISSLLDTCPTERARYLLGEAASSGNALPRAPDPFARIGYLVGRARGLQLVCGRNAPLSRHSAVMGAEVGED